MKWQKAGCRILNIFRQNSKLQSGIVTYLFSIFFTIFLWHNCNLQTFLQFSVLILLFLIIILKWRFWAFTLQGYFLGLVTSLSVLFMDLHQFSFSLLLFIFILASFHFCEFFAIGVSNPDSLTPDSFLLNHSIAYWVANFVSIGEFSCRTYFFKYNPMLIVIVGVFLCIVGDSMRKLAMWHAGFGFTHLLAYKKKKQHYLVTSGVYKLVRHPSYLGYLLFTLGTQLILCNPICFFGFAYICIFKFFRERIYEEERYLVSFFGQNYIQYQKRVPLGLPFIEGFNSFS